MTAFQIILRVCGRWGAKDIEPIKIETKTQGQIQAKIKIVIEVCP